VSISLHQSWNTTHVRRRFAKWKRDAESWFLHDSLMFERLLGKVANDLVSSRCASMDHTTVSNWPTRPMESIGQALRLRLSKIQANMICRNANRPGLSVSCCGSSVTCSQIPRESEGVTLLQCRRRGDNVHYPLMVAPRHDNIPRSSKPSAC
jgi:hypothetical protein